MTLQDLIEIARKWNMPPDMVAVPDLEWVDDGAGRVGFVGMTDIDRMTTPDPDHDGVDWASHEPAVFEPGDPTDTDAAAAVPEDDGPPHPQGTEKLSPEGNPA